MTPPDDEPRDAHLQAALRHAPDRGAAPPAALSAQILAQAQRAAASRLPASAGPGWAERWFGWMSRPVAAGAFGSLLIAGFVGLMWRDGPPPETAAVAEAPVEAPAATPAAAPPPAPATAPAAVPPPPPAAPVPAVPPARPAQAQQKARTTPEAVQATAAPAEASRDAALESRPAAAAAPPAAAPPAAVAPLAAPAPAAARQALATIDPLAPAIAALSAPADSALRGRLQALSDQTRGRWRAVATRAAEADNSSAGASAGPAGEPVFDSQGRLLGHLQVDTEQVIWRAADGRTWRAPALR